MKWIIIFSILMVLDLLVAIFDFINFDYSSFLLYFALAVISSYMLVDAIKSYNKNKEKK